MADNKKYEYKSFSVRLSELNPKDQELIAWLSVKTLKERNRIIKEALINYMNDTNNVVSTSNNMDGLYASSLAAILSRIELLESRASKEADNMVPLDAKEKVQEDASQSNELYNTLSSNVEKESNIENENSMDLEPKSNDMAPRELDPALSFLAGMI